MAKAGVQKIPRDAPIAKLASMYYSVMLWTNSNFDWSDGKVGVHVKLIDALV